LATLNADVDVFDLEMEDRKCDGSLVVAVDDGGTSEKDILEIREL
jgi:hypothetical protein